METQINFTNTYLSPRPVVSLHFSSRRSSGMSSTRKNTKRAQPPLQSLKKQTPNEELHDDLDLDVSSDLKGIMLAKSERKRRKKKEESISSGARLWIEFDDVCYHVQVVELPMLHPEKFVKLGIDPPKGVLCYGPPGTGKTLLARAVANRTDACFIGVIGSELVQKYVGEGARMVHELFQILKDAARVREHRFWGRGPDNTESYNSAPHGTGFFRDGGDYDSYYSRFFLNWYSRVLIDHGDRVLSMANLAFEGSCIAGKLSGIHWWYKTASHAAELTDGFYNPSNRDGYGPIAGMLKKHDVALNFTCVE